MYHVKKKSKQINILAKCLTIYFYFRGKPSEERKIKERRNTKEKKIAKVKNDFIIFGECITELSEQKMTLR